MSQMQSNRPVPLGAVSTLRVVSLFERAIDGFTAWRSSRATAHALSRLSDQQLADIGLIRGDIAEVADTLASR